MSEAALRDPFLRQGAVSVDFMPSSTINSYLNGKKIFTGKIRQQRTNVLFNTPISTWGKNSLRASVSYSLSQMSLKDVQLLDPNLQGIDDKNYHYSTVGLGLGYVHVDSLFGHPIILMTNIFGMTNKASSMQKISYLGGFVFTLKQTADMRSSIGLMVNIDPSIKVPILPAYTYWRRYKSGWELNINLPQRASVFKKLSKNLYFNAYEALTGSVSFLESKQPNIPQDINYSTIDLKSGIGFDYRIGKYFLLGANTGLFTPIQNRAFDKNKSASDYFLRNKIKTTPFVNLTLSVLPF